MAQQATWVATLSPSPAAHVIAMGGWWIPCGGFLLSIHRADSLCSKAELTGLCLLFFLSSLAGEKNIWDTGRKFSQNLLKAAHTFSNYDPFLEHTHMFLHSCKEVCGLVRWDAFITSTYRLTNRFIPFVGSQLSSCRDSVQLPVLDYSSCSFPLGSYTGCLVPRSHNGDSMPSDFQGHQSWPWVHMYTTKQNSQTNKILSKRSTDKHCSVALPLYPGCFCYLYPLWKGNIKGAEVSG